MERAYRALKAFILKDVNAALPRFADAETYLPPLDGRTVCFGAIDPLKTAGETLCAILPESLEIGEGYVSGEGRATASVTCAFWCRGAPYAELMRRICRYADCIAACLAENPSLGGAVLDAEARKIEFDWDCGAADRQAAAALIELSIRIEEEKNVNAAYQEAPDPAIH